MVPTEERDRAREIAIRTLSGQYDPLLACIDLDALRSHLEDVPADVLHTFDGIASEVDELPLGSQRRYWAPEALAIKDVEAARYRDLIRDHVMEQLRRLLAALDGPGS